MTGVSFDVVQWLVNQGVAIAVLAFVLIRLEARLTAIETQLTRLVDALTPKASTYTPKYPEPPKQ